MRSLLPLALAVALVAPGVAHAQAPVPLGNGTQPAVTVDGAGTAHIAWISRGADPTTLHFCRLPRGATVCAVNRQIPVPGTSLTRPYVTVDGGTIRVLSYRYGLTPGRFDAVYMLTSTDGGATFDGGSQIGTLPFTDAVRSPGDRISMIADNSAAFQQAPLAPGPVLARADLTPDHPYNPSIAHDGPNTLVAVFAAGGGAAQFRRHLGNGDPNDASTWTPAQDFAEYSAYNRFASGPTGVFLLSANASNELTARRFAPDGSGFLSPVALPGPARPIVGGAHDIAEDGGGRLHAVWPFGDADGSHIGYATSDDGGNWQATRFDVSANPADTAQAPVGTRVGIAPDHIGVAVFETAGGPAGPTVNAVAVGPSAGVGRPEIGKTAVASVVSGTVRVRFPRTASPGRAKAVGLAGATQRFVPLTGETEIPIGSTLDTTKGKVQLATSAGTTRPDQTGRFNGGRFQLGQSPRNPLTTLTLSGGKRLRCGNGTRAFSRTLFSNARGRFRTRGRRSSATVRGTAWITKDSCAGTTTIVRQGRVVVRDLGLRKNRVLRAGQRYTARATRKRRG